MFFIPTYSILDLYRKVLAQEFIREMNFLADVWAGRATAKGDFTDKIMNIGMLGVSEILANVSVPGSGLLGTGMQIAVDWFNEKRKEGKFEHVGQLQAEIDQEQLRILLDWVSFEVCRRCEFIIKAILSATDKGKIVAFAKVGVERMLEYVARHRLSLTIDHLLMGIIAGHSGGYVTDFTNTRLTAQDSASKTKLSAEGAYGRSAFMTLNSAHHTYEYWALRDKTKAKHKLEAPGKKSLWDKMKIKKEALYNYGYVKFDKNNKNDPKYGYMLVPSAVVDFFYQAHKGNPQDPTSLSPSLRKALTTFIPSVQVVDFADIQDYLKNYKQPVYPFNEYLKRKYPHLVSFKMSLYLPQSTREADLTHLDFSNSNFNDCILNGCQFSGSLANAQFQRAGLVNADFTRITDAKKANFSEAHLEYLKAKGVNLDGAIFIHTQLHYADLQGAFLRSIQALGAVWVGAILTDIHVDDPHALRESQQQQQFELKKYHEEVKALQTKIQDQDKTLETLSQLTKRLETVLETVNITEVKDEIKVLQTQLANLMQDKMTQEAEGRFFRAELQSLRNQVQENKKNSNTQANSLNLLEDQFQKQHSEFTGLIKSIEMTVKQLEQQNVYSIEKLRQQQDELSRRIQSYQARQQEQIDQIMASFVNIQAEMIQFKEEVQKLKTQETVLAERQSELQSDLHRVEANTLSAIEQQEVLFAQVRSLQQQIIALQNERTKSPIDPKHLIPFSLLKIEAKLTEGSFGKIYLGRWSGEKVVIKMIEDCHEEERKEFIREVQIMSRLHHPNITQFFGANQEEDHTCLVMEYMAQGSLYDVLEKNQLSPEQQRQLALDIAHGLHYLHTCSDKVLHRDLKSANILVNQWRAKITDFGLAKIHTQSVRTSPKQSQAIQWMAPECFDYPTPQYTEASDIYSYGMILWEMITGKHPYQGLSTKVIIERICASNWETIPSDMPSVYADLIQRCWHKDPAERPRLTEIIEKIEAYQPPKKSTPDPTKLAEDYYKQGVEHEKRQEWSKALECYQKAAELGSGSANNNLGLFYLHGKGLVVTQDKRKAYQYFLAGAEKGSVRAMYNTAQMLEFGDGIQSDIAQALYWYQKVLPSYQHNAKKQPQDTKVQKAFLDLDGKCKELQKRLAEKPNYQGELESRTSSLAFSAALNNPGQSARQHGFHARSSTRETSRSEQGDSNNNNIDENDNFSMGRSSKAH